MTVDDVSGATFTFTNLGSYGVRQFSGIVTPPQVGPVPDHFLSVWWRLLLLLCAGLSGLQKCCVCVFALVHLPCSRLACWPWVLSRSAWCLTLTPSLRSHSKQLMCCPLPSPVTTELLTVRLGQHGLRLSGSMLSPRTLCCCSCLHRAMPLAPPPPPRSHAQPDLGIKRFLFYTE